MLTLYNRPQNLLQQIELLQAQTLPPEAYMVFQDETAPPQNLTLPGNLSVSVHHIKTSENVGVWGRFAAALLAKTPYVCVFDDDTMPGRRWLENCMTSFEQQPGLYGTIGIVLHKAKRYPFSHYSRLGWDGPVERTTEVDLVGHSWFFKRDWLGCLWLDSSDFFAQRLVSEDFFFSYQLRRYLGIQTYVPPHPSAEQDPSVYELYGSDPRLAYKLGQDEAAVSMNPANLERMNTAMRLALSRGFQPLKWRNPWAYWSTVWRHRLLDPPTEKTARS